MKGVEGGLDVRVVSNVKRCMSCGTLSLLIPWNKGNGNCMLPVSFNASMVGFTMPLNWHNVTKRNTTQNCL